MTRGAILLFVLMSVSGKAQTYRRDLFPGNCTPDQRFCAFFSPDDSPIYAVNAFLDEARQSIRILTDNMNVVEFRDTLQAQVNRGLSVEFLADFRLSFASNMVWNTLSSRPNLFRARVPVLRSPLPRMQNRFILIDAGTPTAVLLISSAPLTYAGLVADQANVIAIRDGETIQRYLREFQEGKNIALAACRWMSTRPQGCGGVLDSSEWKETFYRQNISRPGEVEKLDSAVELGYVLPEMIYTEATPGSPSMDQLKKCQELLPHWIESNNQKYLKSMSILNAQNQPKKDLLLCLKDENWKKFLTDIALKERFADDTLVSQIKNYWNYRPQVTGAVRSYSIPEDSGENVLMGELHRAIVEEAPTSSFVYVTANFSNNRRLLREWTGLQNLGVRTRVSQSNIVLRPRSTVQHGFAIVGTNQGIRVILAPADWSEASLNGSDAMITVIDDPNVAALYLKQFLSEMLVGRYKQDLASEDFLEELGFLKQRLPCLAALLGLQKNCSTVAGYLPQPTLWEPNRKTSVMLAVNASLAPQEQLWVWAPKLGVKNEGVALPLFSSEDFAGRWVGSLPVPLNAEISFKFFKAPRGVWRVTPDDIKRGGVDTGRSFSRLDFEFENSFRTLPATPLSVGRIPKLFTFAQP